MEKKKVLHIVESFGSGVFSFLVDLINDTDEQFDITVAYGVRKETLNNFKDYFSDRVKFIKVENFTRSINPVKDIKTLFEIKKVIKDIKPDVIHLHSSKAGFIGRFAASGKKYKMLYNPHGFSFLMKDSSKIKRILYWLLEKIGGFRKCTVIGCSHGEYEEALKLTSNAICINNGINIEKMKQKTNKLGQRNIDFKNLKICTSGRIGYQKNPELFNKIAECFPKLQFTWIGDGDLKNKLVSPNIKITGWLTREETLEIVNNNDIFILTSLWEGLPLSLLEAMYLKKVCLVTNCIGNKDVINDKDNGYIIDNINFKNIIKKISSENLYNEIANNAHNDVVKYYNTKVMSKKYIEIYKNKL